MKRNLVVFFSAALLVFFVGSCKKVDTTTIGDDLIPAVDNINTFDTVLEVFTDNLFLPDSTRLLATELHPWGMIENDAEFGKTKTEFYVSLTPSSYGTHPFAKKDENPIFDSVILALSYSSLYGDSNSMQKIDVHEIEFDNTFRNRTAGFRIDTADFNFDPTVLGSKLVDFTKLNDSVYDIRKRDTLRLKNQLRIPLNTAFANRFVALDTATAYKTDSAFRLRFQGLALTIDEGASPAKRAIAYFALTNPNTKLIFYYRVRTGTTVTDTLSAEFGFHSFNFANAATVRRTPAGNYLTSVSNAVPNDDKIYLQSSPGSYTAIRIPGLKNLSNRVIHRADLSFEVLPSAESNFYGLPTSLFMDAIDTANKRITTVPYDFSFNSDYANTFGGNIKNNKYTFNLSRYVQSIVTRKEKDFTLRLYAPYVTVPTDFATGLIPPSVLVNTPIASGRVVLTGGSYADITKRVRLRIIYSKI